MTGLRSAALRERIRQALRPTLLSATTQLARRLGYQLVPRGPYSPIPPIDELSETLWQTPRSLAGVAFDDEAQLLRLERELRPWIDEFHPPHAPTGRPGDFYLHNHSYESVDAEILYATIRHQRPARVLELGSGYSTLLVADACAANARDGDAPATHQVIDPAPAPVLRGRLDPSWQL